MAWGPGQDLVMEDVELSPPQSMEIRIKVVCTSLCRSDLSAWQSQSQVFPYSSFFFFSQITLFRPASKNVLDARSYRIDLYYLGVINNGVLTDIGLKCFAFSLVTYF